MAAGHDPPSQELVDLLRLVLVPGVGPRTRRTLLEHFGTPGAVLSAAPSALREVPGVGPKLSRALASAAEEIDAEAEIELCRREGVQLVTEADPHYPRPLRQLPDPPGVLFVRGRLDPRDELSIAIVGTRHGTPYGLQQAERLAGSLARAGLCIASGLARGIDAAAHRGALAAGGRTVAVLGSGVLNVYPPEHQALADQIASGGALVSEAPPRAVPLPGAFPQRNRIISGLSLGVVVVEAAQQSGALITARLAMEQNRLVFAVPGRVDSRASRGCHQLLRDGATLVESADDVLEALGPLVAAVPRDDGPPIHHPAELLLNEVEQQVLGAVGNDAATVDQLVGRLDLPVQQVLATLSVLEMRHLVRRLSGTRLVRV